MTMMTHVIRGQRASLGLGRERVGWDGPDTNQNQAGPRKGPAFPWPFPMHGTSIQAECWCIGSRIRQLDTHKLVALHLRCHEILHDIIQQSSL